MRLFALAVACICVFDFDLTLRIIKGTDSDSPAPDAKAVIWNCKIRGCSIAIASANGNENKLKHVLGSKIDPAVFTDAFLSSPAFQFGHDDKSISLRAIRHYYQPDVSPSCIVLFDDQWFNKQYADKTGSIFIKVDPKVGVALKDWEQAFTQMKKIGCFNNKF